MYTLVNSNLSIESATNYDNRLSSDYSLYNGNQYDYTNSSLSSGYTSNLSINNSDNFYNNYNLFNDVHHNNSNVANYSSFNQDYYQNYNYYYYNDYYYYYSNQTDYNNSNSISSTTDMNTNKVDASYSLNLIKSNSQHNYQNLDYCKQYDISQIKQVDPINLQSTPIYHDNLMPSQSYKNKKYKPRNIINQLEQLSPKDNFQKRNYRTSFTTQQRYYLLQIFEKSLYPSRDVLEEAAKILNVSVKTLQTWFKNARCKHNKLKNIKKL
jgi:hypothetical protein